MSDNSFSRRDFLKTGALSSLALGSGLMGRSTAPAKKFKSNPGDAKNVIFLVSDGMSSGTMTLADLVKQDQYGDKTHWIKLYESDREYHRGLMDMASLNSTVTDSAAAASSWGCGQRINNGAVNWGPNDEQYKTICEIFRDADKGTGLVTTARLTHATPSGFGINMPARGMENEIAVQYSERGYDVLMGGGNRHFHPLLREDGRDLYSEFTENGYTIARTKRELNRATRNSKLLGIFDDSHLPYTVDQNTLSDLQEGVPTLAEMTSSALDRLSQNENGFVLQIEGARVDHAAHGNDPAGMIYDQIAFDDAIKQVMDFSDGRDDTLVILTTDHGNANPGLSGLGSGYGDSPNMMATLYDYRHSFEWMYEEFTKQMPAGSGSFPQVNTIRNVVEYATQTQITTDEALMIKRAFQGTFEAPFSNREGVGAVLAGVLANYNGIYFIGTNHTADYVELAAWGPGSDRIPTFVRNTALFDLMVEMAGVREYAQG
ncbi:alkaline phosphatase [Rhodohalobacter sp. 8-1]|uniref:alkaline phosphatase n=1 Tax=Rhodohalobacter sp. 8-1 TaxID=3131972 RepID=UPI0030EF672D